MKLGQTNTDIVLTLYLSSSMLNETTLQHFQQSLIHLAPEWASGLHLHRFGEPRVSIDATRDGAVRDVVFTQGLERGELYQRLQQLAPPPSPNRRFGSVELRGANRELTIILRFDDWVFCPLGQSWIPGNQIAVQIRSALVQSRGALTWINQAFAHWCATLDPFFGFTCATEEYDAKNMSTEGGGSRAVGIDISQYLPGLYWLNFFGSPYRPLMGDECLAGAPAFRTSASGSGYVVTLNENPGHWDSSEYKTREESVRRHLGEEYFFIRTSQEGKTVSPFHLPKLPAQKISVEAEVDSESGIKEIRVKEHRE
jgi:hypothetical protein